VAPGRPRPPRRRLEPPESPWRRAAAALLLLAAVGGVLWLATTRYVDAPQESTLSPAALVKEVGARAGLEDARVHAEEIGEGQGAWWDVRVHVPAGFDAQPLLLDLQAAAHNQGGRLDPLPVTEGGGYGLGALFGTVGGRNVRVVLLGDEPRPRPVLRKGAKVAGRPRLAIVLDDAGHSPADVELVAQLPPQVAVAVLPNAAYARQVAQDLVRQGREVLIHLPMEPRANGNLGPGEGAILVGLSDEEVRRRVEAARAAVPGAAGVNNHMGSRATGDEPTMAAVMAALAGQGLYFLDSRTTAASLALGAARRAGIPAVQRDVFLDVVAEEPAVRRALGEAVEVARANGSAVAIGHVHPATVAVLRQEVARALEGVELVPPSQLVR